MTDQYKYNFPHDSIKSIFDLAESNLEEIIGKEVKVVGWIRTVRHQKLKDNDNNEKLLSFCSLNDGSTSDCLQIVVSGDNNKDGCFDDFYKNSGTGCSLRAIGKIIKSPAKGQLIELVAHTVLLEGTVIGSDTYPLAKKKKGHTLEYLRNHCHLRPRASTFGSVFRIRNSLIFATHKFYQERNFLNVDPNIITINECEGGAGVFTVSEMFKDDTRDIPLVDRDNGTEVDWSQDHFRRKAFLTVSSQLQLEALACSLGNVYTMNKSFRSEHSSTSKHVSEFTHLEIEQCFTDFNDLMNIAEDYVRYIILYILEHNEKDLNALNKYISKGIIERLIKLSTSEFKRMTYHEAIKEIQDDLKEKKTKMKIRPKIGDDLGSEHENYLTKKYDCPVFITHWPIAIKSFYMKQCSYNKTCESFDLLMPHGIGELIGASQREESYEKLTNRMDKLKIYREPLSFYTDLRKYGTCQHGGFGLGIDRFLMLLTGMKSIKDVIPFPVYFGSCNY